MPENKISNNPDFDGDDQLAPEEGDQEVKESPTEEVEEGDTQSDASSDEESVDDSDDESGQDDEDSAEEQARALRGLSEENKKLDSDLELLRQEIVQKRQERRKMKEELKSMPAQQQQEEVDLSDIDPEDVERINKILKAQGYAPVQEIEQKQLKTAQQQVESDFFEKHPEYKPENDTNDVLYNALREEFGMFAQPKTPQQVKSILDRAHREVARRFPSQFPSTEPSKKDNARAARRSVATAGSGSSSSSRSGGSKSTLTTDQIQQLKDGGFTDEEIAEM